jgi:hypothetical protein
MSAAVLDLSTRRIKIYASAYDATARADLDEHAADVGNPHQVTKAQVGLANVDNTSDAAKPVSTAQATALAAKAPLASPALTGIPTAPTAVLGTVSAQLATTEFVQAAVNALDIPDVTGDLTAHLADNDNPHAVTASDVGLGAVDNTADLAKPVSAAQQIAINAVGAEAAEVAADLDNHLADTTNPHQVTKTQVGLGAVDNTADLAKPVSAAQQAAINIAAAAAGAAQADIDGHQANTANPHAVTKAQVGLGAVDNTSDLAKPVSTATQAAINAAVAGVGGDTIADDLAEHMADVANPHAVTKTQVGLGAVDNTADLAKPVSAAQQTAINVASAAAAAAQADIDGHQANTSNPHAVDKIDVGLGNVANLAPADLPVSTATQSALNTKAPLSAATDATQALANATAAQTDADQAIADAAAAQADATQAQAAAAAAQADADAAQADATEALDAIVGLGATITGVGGTSRPGETPALYGQSKTGPAGTVVPVDTGWVATSAAGSILRIDAATAADPQTIAPSAPVPLEAGRLYDIRWKVQRQTDPADPLNDSVQLGIQWLNSSKSALASTMIANLALVVADAVVERSVLVAFDDPLADLAVPSGAVYFRPFVDLYGDSHVTDVIVLETQDATAAGVGGGAPLYLPLLDANPVAGPGVGLMALYGVRNADGSATLRVQAGISAVPQDIVVIVGSGAL